MSDDPKRVVKDGYDRLGPRYLEWTLSVDPVHRVEYQAAAMQLLEPGSLVVELGCGPGVPTGQLVTEHHQLIGVDLSASQLSQARVNVPAALLVLADMSHVEFASSGVDAVLAFYSIIHLPRDDQVRVMAAVARWLRPGGVFALNLGTNNDPGGTYSWVDDVPMFWSAFDPQTALAMVSDAGFEIIRNEVLENFEDDQIVRFLWILARKR
jgi:ubiquinone/menaquinone biosynthesis C-methylase UbiE